MYASEFKARTRRCNQILDAAKGIKSDILRTLAVLDAAENEVDGRFHEAAFSEDGERNFDDEGDRYSDATDLVRVAIALVENSHDPDCLMLLEEAVKSMKKRLGKTACDCCGRQTVKGIGCACTDGER